ncbi:Hypothetical_protein [Hexamita inflata]|uniref:Hypothetical_protein n=1 Tax=Hexamita inflata TaxID=28002 RepID=A0AA86TTV5_9EUKA|nr:Hypothetical protein HINF_LOCUS16171 [Hexamita inflata]
MTKCTIKTEIDGMQVAVGYTCPLTMPCYTKDNTSVCSYVSTDACVNSASSAECYAQKLSQCNALCPAGAICKNQLGNFTTYYGTPGAQTLYESSQSINYCYYPPKGLSTGIIVAIVVIVLCALYTIGIWLYVYLKKKCANRPKKVKQVKVKEVEMKPIEGMQTKSQLGQSTAEKSQSQSRLTKSKLGEPSNAEQKAGSRTVSRQASSKLGDMQKQSSQLSLLPVRATSKLQISSKPQSKLGEHSNTAGKTSTSRPPSNMNLPPKQVAFRPTSNLAQVEVQKESRPSSKLTAQNAIEKAQSRPTSQLKPQEVQPEIKQEPVENLQEQPIEQTQQQIQDNPVEPQTNNQPQEPVKERKRVKKHKKEIETVVMEELKERKTDSVLSRTQELKMEEDQ